MKKFFLTMSLLIPIMPACAMMQENKEELHNTIVVAAYDQLQKNKSDSVMTKEDIKNIVELTLDMEQEKRDEVAKKREDQKIFGKVLFFGGGLLMVSCVLVAVLIPYGIVQIVNTHKNSTATF